MAPGFGGSGGWGGCSYAAGSGLVWLEKRGPGEWKEAKGFRIYLVGQKGIEQIMSWHQIATEEEFGEAIRFAATLIPVERVRVAS